MPATGIKMNLLIVQIIFLLVMFLLTFVFLLLGPLWIFQTNSNQQVTAKSQRIMSLCNCFSGGVFLAVCFMGLMPFVKTKFNSVFQMMGVNITYPVAELFTVMGFFLVLLTEQCVHKCQHHSSSTSGHADSKEVMLKLPTDYVMYTDSSDDETDWSEQVARDDSTTTDKVASTQSSLMSGSRDHAPDTPPVVTTSADHAHGHSHLEAFQGNSGLRSAVLLLALGVHQVFEGMAMGLQDNFGQLLNLYVAVLVHECLVTLAVGINLAKARMSTGTIIKLGLILCAMIPVGMALGIGLGQVHSVWGGLSNGIIQALAAGTFIYVIFLEVLPLEINSNHDKLLKVFFMFFGFIVIAALRTAAN